MDENRFTVSIAYKLINEEHREYEQRVWLHLWKTRAPNKIRVFSWLVRRSRVMCNMERNRRGFSPTEACSICGDQCEDVDYVLLKCTNAREVWHHVFPPTSPMSDMSLDFNAWFDHIVTCNYGGPSAKKWKAKFVAPLWWI